MLLAPTSKRYKAPSGLTARGWAGSAGTGGGAGWSRRAGSGVTSQLEKVRGTGEGDTWVTIVDNFHKALNQFDLGKVGRPSWGRRASHERLGMRSSRPAWVARQPWRGQ